MPLWHPKEIAVSQTIKPESSVSLIILAALAVAFFTLVTWVEPSFQQIEVNAAEIRSNSSDIHNIQSTQKDYLKHMIDVTNSLSRIEGRLDASRVQQGYPQQNPR